jgi:hypothetical protein
MPKSERAVVALRRSSRFQPVAPKIKYYKLLSANMRHYGFQYKEGLNVDTQPFNPSGWCSHGGLYYTSHEHVDAWCKPDWPLIADVTVPDDARVYAEPCGTKWKADKLVLSNIRPISEVIATLDEAQVIDLAVAEPRMLQYVTNQTEGVCLAAVHNDPTSLEFVKNQTNAICLAAIRELPYALQFVRKQTEELCLAAIREFPHALQFVRKQTEQLCLAAVQFCGNALKYVTNQTDEICLAAVQQNGGALVHVRNQTEAICLAAVQQNVCALWHVQNQTEAVCRAAYKRDARIARR